MVHIHTPSSFSCVHSTSLNEGGGDTGQKVCASPLVPLVIGKLLKVQVGWLQANLAKAAVRRDCCVLFLSFFFLSSFFSASLLMVSTRISTTPRQADLSWASSRQSCSMPHFTNPAAPVHSSDTSDHLLTGLLVRTNTHTHTCTCTCTCIYYSQN